MTDDVIRRGFHAAVSLLNMELEGCEWCFDLGERAHFATRTTGYNSCCEEHTGACQREFPEESLTELPNAKTIHAINGAIDAIAGEPA